MTLSPGARLGPYEITSAIGAGGMGEVYRARDARLGREVAIKVLPANVARDDAHRHRFEREARAVAALNHPHICALYDIGCEGTVDFLVMELLAGETLASRLRRGALPLAQALAVGREVAEALAAAHRQGIVHRDLKPSNIILTKDGAKLLDFGLAKLRPSLAEVGTEGARATTHEPGTLPGAVLGTIPYMAPEQLEGKETDTRTDLFAFGCLLYEMVSGRRAFTGASEASVISAIMTSEPPSLGTLQPLTPASVERLVCKCLAKDPDERWQSAADVADALGWAVTEPTAQRPAATSLVWLFAGLAVVTVATLSWLVASGRLLLGSGARPEPGAAASVSSAPLQMTAAAGWESEPVLNHDGSLVAYTSNASGNADVWVSGAGGGNAVNVSSSPADDEGPAWFLDGTAIVFASTRGGGWNIWKAPALGGGVTLLVRNARAPAVSPDGELIAFVRPDDTGTDRIMVAKLADISTARTLTDTPYRTGEPEADPAWSPNSRSICYSSYRSLWVAEAAGGAPRRLTHDRQVDVEPAWSGDGRTIYFSSFRGGLWAIWKVDAAAGTPYRVTRGPGPERHPSLSGDGARLAFSTLSENLDLVLHDLSSGREHQFGITRDETSPALSPDNRTLVYVSEMGPDGTTELWVQALVDGQPAGAPRRLSEQAGSVSLPGFSADGQWIVYQRVLHGQRDVWTISAAGGEPVRITDGESDNTFPAYSPDGTSIAFVSTRGGNAHVWRIPVTEGRAAGAMVQVTKQAGNQEAPAWSPDGRELAYVVPTSAGAEVWTTQTDGSGAPRPATDGAEARWVQWDPLGRGIVVAGTWGESVLSLRLVKPGTRAAGPFDPPVIIGDPSLSYHPAFSISRDGRLAAFSRCLAGGDIYVMGLGR